MFAANRATPEKESESGFQSRMLNTLRDSGFDVPDRAVVVDGRWNRCTDLVAGDSGIQKSAAFMFDTNARTGAPFCLYKSFRRDVPSEHRASNGDAIEYARGWFERTRSPAPNLGPAANQSIHAPAPTPIAPYVSPPPQGVAERLALQPAQRAEMEGAAVAIAELVRTGTKIEVGERTYLKNPDLNPAGLTQTSDHKITVPIYRPTADLSGVELAGGQLISGSGFKHFTPGTKTRGGFALIPSTLNPEKWLKRLAETDKPLILCEGVGTALAIYQSTGYPVMACLSAKNLPQVAEWLVESGRAAGKTVVVVGDNDLDHAEPGAAFVGIRQATKAAEILGCNVVVPNSEQRGYDARDLLREHGEQSIRDYIVDGAVTPEVMRASERPEAFVERVEREIDDEPEFER